MDYYDKSPNKRISKISEDSEAYSQLMFNQPGRRTIMQMDEENR